MTRHPTTCLAIVVFAATSALAQTVAPTSRPAHLAFPGAEGFGANASGGRGGEVVHVTTLDDAGPGSFREAVSQPNRTVVFDIGGVINVKSNVPFSDNLTVAGQTAPGGIAIYGGGISITGSNVIVRYLTVRGGIASGRGSKPLNITAGKNVICDHLSVGWGRWDNGGITKGSSDVTIQNTIFAEAIQPQKFGMLLDSSRRITIARNLWINNRARNPKGKGDVQYVNNVIYNWGNQGFGGGHSAAPWNQDLIGNYVIAGPDSNESFFNFANENDRVYSEGNYVDLDKNGTLDGRPWTADDITKPDPRKKDAAADAADPADPADAAPPTTKKKLRESATAMPSAYNVSPVPVRITSAEQAVADVIAGAGNTKYWDAVDARQIAQLKSFGTLGKNPDDEHVVGGMPPAPAPQPAIVDADRDGMADAWERESNLDPATPTDGNADDDGDGYTNLEEYLNKTDPRSRN